MILHSSIRYFVVSTLLCFSSSLYALAQRSYECLYTTYTPQLTYGKTLHHSLNFGYHVGLDSTRFGLKLNYDYDITFLNSGGYQLEEIEHKLPQGVTKFSMYQSSSRVFLTGTFNLVPVELFAVRTGLGGFYENGSYQPEDLLLPSHFVINEHDVLNAFGGYAEMDIVLKLKKLNVHLRSGINRYLTPSDERLYNNFLIENPWRLFSSVGVSINSASKTRS